MAESFLKSFIVFQNRFLFPVLANHGSLKGMTVLSFSILMSLYYACLYIFSRAQSTLMTLPFGIKYFPFCIARYKFFNSQGRFMRLGRTPFGIQVSMVVLKTFPQLGLYQGYPSMKAESRLPCPCQITCKLVLANCKQ